MQKIIAIVVLTGLAWYGYGKYRAEAPAAGVVSPQPAVASPPPASSSSFRCDGRTYCSQMTSCAEAKYFLNNCPGTKMDGDHDGIPCESQWCK